MSHLIFQILTSSQRQLLYRVTRDLNGSEKGKYSIIHSFSFEAMLSVRKKSCSELCAYNSMKHSLHEHFF